MQTEFPLPLKALNEASGKLLHVQRVLRDAGFLAWLAGGCVRDALLGRVPQDFDLVTDASVEQVRSLFPKTVAVGAAFGVVLVIHEGEEFEIAQFRKESDYRDGRHPSLVESATPAKDARRRDLTVNALFYDPHTQILYDYVQGLADVRSRTLRAVGAATVRFQEDHLRILRVLRFKAQLGFAWEPELEKALRAQKDLLAKVSRERVREEILKMSKAAHWPNVTEFLVEAGINGAILPGLAWQVSAHESLKAATDEAVWWEWGLWAVRSGNSVAQVQESLGTLRLSKAEQKSLEHFLFWFDAQAAWQSRGLGALVERSFEPGAREGLQTWFRLHPGWPHEPRLQILLRKYPQRPAPWVRAEDLPGLKGALLGQTLRELYQRQLEGLDSGRDESLARVRAGRPD